MPPVHPPLPPPQPPTASAHKLDPFSAAWGAGGAAKSLHHTARPGVLHFLRTCLGFEWSSPSLSFERGVHGPSSPPSVTLRPARPSGSKSFLLRVLRGPRLPASPASPHCAQTPPPQCPGHASCRLQFSASLGQAQQVTCFLCSSVTASLGGWSQAWGSRAESPSPHGAGNFTVFGFGFPVQETQGFVLFQVVLIVKNLPASAEDVRDSRLIPGSGSSPGEGNGNPLQYPCMENPMDRGA